MKFCTLSLVFGLSLLSWFHESRAENIDCDENGKCRELSSKDEPEIDKDEPEGVSDLDTTDGDKKHESDPLPKIGRINLSSTKRKAGKKDRKKKGGKKDPKKKPGKGKKTVVDRPKKKKKGKNPVKVMNTTKPQVPPVLQEPEVPQEQQEEQSEDSSGEDSLSFGGEEDSLSFGAEDSLLPYKEQPEKPEGLKGRSKDTGNTYSNDDVGIAGFTGEKQSGLPDKVKGKASFLYIGGALGILCVVAGIVVVMVIKQRKKSEENDEEELMEEIENEK